MSTSAKNIKVAVITGSSRGLGAAAARRLAKDGFFIVVNYVRSQADGEKVVREIIENGGKATLVQGDVSTIPGIDTFFRRVDEALVKEGLPAKLDVLVANAGVLVSKTFSDTTEADFDRLYNTNVKGVFFLVQRALPRLRDNGRIVTLSSGLSRFANPMFTAYSGTKGAIDVMTRIWAELARRIGSSQSRIAKLEAAESDVSLDLLFKALFATGAKRRDLGRIVAAA